MKPYFEEDDATIYHGDALSVLRELPDDSVNCCITSPPYWGLRDYGVAGQLGLECTPEEYVARLVEVFREVRRVLRKDGTLFLNLGDSYTASGGGGHKDWHANPGLSRSSKRGGVPHEASYGTSDKAPEDFQDRGCLCGSLCDACRAAYRIGKSHNSRRPAPTPELSPSAPIREHMASAHGHLPTSGSALSEARTEDAIADLAPLAVHGGERSPASVESTPCGSSQPRPESRSEVSTHAGVCLLCGCSLPDSGPGCAGMSGESSETPSRTRGTASLCGALQNHSQDTCEYCSRLSPYPQYTTAYLKPKDLVGIPWRVAFALQSDGWCLRSDIIWAKPNPMPESVTDRPTRSHEYIFLLAKSESYYYDHEAIKEPSVSDHGSGNGFKRPARLSFADDDGARGSDEPWKPRSKRDSFKREGSKREQAIPGHSMGTHRPNRQEDDWDTSTRNKRDVWAINTDPFPGAHFATFPPDLILPCIKAGCPLDGVVLDPFGGSGTTMKVSRSLGRRGVMVELNEEYCEMAAERLRQWVLEMELGFQL